ncbi:hypothetical protein [Mesorhizobium sp.]|uniref:hypothetical protein n=1 Tax=Mesorhizobium sp. TaxID=1871066 RepID=UPI0025CEF9DE|nr:hypothetical protein [Mesorhizobium sp.]
MAVFCRAYPSPTPDEELPYEDPDNAGSGFHECIGNVRVATGIDDLKQFQYAGGRDHKDRGLIQSVGEAERQGEAQQDISQGALNSRLGYMRPHLDRRQGCENDDGKQRQRYSAGQFGHALAYLS